MILSLHHCTTIDVPELELYRTLRRTREHREQGVFVAEGNKIVYRLLDSPLTVVSVLLTPEWFECSKALLENRPEALTVFIAEKKLLETIVGIDCHQGIMAVGIVPSKSTLESTVLRAPYPRLFVAIDGITSAENTGVVIRNCAACGAGALIVGETNADPYLRRSVRNSMGTIFKIPVVRTECLFQTLSDLRKNHGFRIIAAHPRPASLRLFETGFSGNCCVVFGHEGHGISEQVVDVCDETIMIPMAEGIDSFNVGCASAIILYEAVRQRYGNAQNLSLPGSN